MSIAALSTCCLRCANVGAGILFSISDCASSMNVPVGLPEASRMILPPSGSFVSRVTPAARIAALFATPAWPSTRLSHTG